MARLFHEREGTRAVSVQVVEMSPEEAARLVMGLAASLARITLTSLDAADSTVTDERGVQGRIVFCVRHPDPA